MSACAQVAFDLTWRTAFEPIEVACDGMVVAALPTSATSAALPRVAISLRDESGLVAGLGADSAAYAQLRRQPSDTAPVTPFSVAPDEEGLYSSTAPRRPWCIRGGCGERQQGCTTAAKLTGTVVKAASSGVARAVRRAPLPP